VTVRRFPVVRVLGGAALALVLWVLLRGTLGAGLATGVAAVAAAAGAWFFPRFVLARILWTVPLFLALIFVTIQLMFLAPGDPFASEKNASTGVRAKQREMYGLFDPDFAGACKFFRAYTEELLTKGNLGPSIKWEGRGVADILLPAFPVSITLGLLALSIAAALGLAIGIRAGLRPGSFADGASMAFATIGISLPSFVIGAALLIVFSLRLGWLPLGGWGGYPHLVLPAVTLALPYAAYIARLARSGTIEVMSQDFVRTARAKGLPESEVVLKHAFKGAVTPVVSYLGPAAAQILTGSFVIEMLFGVPGMGQYFVKGALNRDYYVVLGTMLLYSSLLVLFNLLVDMAYAWLDPRVRERA
jgi:oligopeptide transport system permease protein